MILSGILWMLLWPGVIILSYYLIRFAVKKYEHHLDKTDEA